MSCIKIDKPLVAYRFSGNVMMFVQNHIFTQEKRFQSNLNVIW